MYKGFRIDTSGMKPEIQQHMITSVERPRNVDPTRCTRFRRIFVRSGPLTLPPPVDQRVYKTTCTIILIVIWQK